MAKKKIRIKPWIQPRKPRRPIRRTPQEWFDAAWERAKIKVQSRHGSACMYSAQTKDVPGCFIGVSLHPSHAAWLDSPAASKFAGGSTFIGDLTEIIAPPEGVDEDFLTDLQAIHDGYYPGEWELALRKFAKRYNLTIPEEP